MRRINKQTATFTGKPASRGFCIWQVGLIDLDPEMDRGWRGLGGFTRIKLLKVNEPRRFRSAKTRVIRQISGLSFRSTE